MKLDLYHHKFIMALLVLVVFIVGVLFGAHILGSTGGEAMLVLLFGLLFLNSVLLYVLFTQVLHVRDDLEKLSPHQEDRKVRRR